MCKCLLMSIYKLTYWKLLCWEWGTSVSFFWCFCLYSPWRVEVHFCIIFDWDIIINYFKDAILNNSESLQQNSWKDGSWLTLFFRFFEWTINIKNPGIRSDAVSDGFSLVTSSEQCLYIAESWRICKAHRKIITLVP